MLPEWVMAKPISETYAIVKQEEKKRVWYVVIGDIGQLQLHSYNWNAGFVSVKNVHNIHYNVFKMLRQIK